MSGKNEGEWYSYLSILIVSFSELEIMDVNRHFASYRSLLQNENKQVQESEEDEFLYKVCENLEEDLFCKNISESVDIIVDILSEIVSKI